MPTDHEIARWRLRSQHLVTPHAPDAAAAVSHLVAVQAENPSQSAWAVAARTATPDAADLNLLLASGAVIRTHVLRPTWHYVAADDVAWLIDVTAPRVRRSADHVMREVFGLARSRAEAAAGVLLDVLGEGRPLDRPTLAARVTDRGHDLTGQQLMMLLADLELQCLVCSGPPADGHHTYALFADRVPHPRRLDREEALAELALRYVAGHGPVTERDLAYWATLTLGDARAGLRAVADRLVSFEHHDRTFWHLPDQSPPSDAGEPRGHLLQVLDETYRGYQDSRWVLDAAGAVPRSRETAIGMALVDGQLVASMKRTVS
ncbi:MAG: winged helix DNA-binding domain-containing protein, partial [Nocardioides sp.]